MTNFSPTQEKALLTLLSSPTVREAARSVGIGEATLYRWLQDPEFKTRYRELRRENMLHATARIQSTVADAIDTLQSIACDKKASAAARVAAARVLLDSGFRSIEVEDLGIEIEKLSETVENLKAQSTRPQEIEY